MWPTQLKCDIRAANDGMVGCKTNECTTDLLYSDRLYYLWHGIKSYGLHIRSAYSRGPVAGTYRRGTCFGDQSPSHVYSYFGSNASRMEHIFGPCN